MGEEVSGDEFRAPGVAHQPQGSGVCSVRGPYVLEQLVEVGDLRVVVGVPPRAVCARGVYRENVVASCECGFYDAVGAGQAAGEVRVVAVVVLVVELLAVAVEVDDQPGLGGAGGVEPASGARAVGCGESERGARRGCRSLLRLMMQQGPGRDGRHEADGGATGE